MIYTTYSSEYAEIANKQHFVPQTLFTFIVFCWIFYSIPQYTFATFLLQVVLYHAIVREHLALSVQPWTYNEWTFNALPPLK